MSSSCYISAKLGSQKVCLKHGALYSNDDTGMILAYFTAKSCLFPYAFVWEKDKHNMSIYNIKVGRCSQSYEYMKRYEYTGMTLTYFTTKSYLFPYAFVWEKDKNNMFVYNIKVGRCSQSNEYMKCYEYQKSRSFIDLHPRSLGFNIFKLLFLRNL